MDNDNNLFLIFDVLADRDGILDAVRSTLVEWVRKTCEVRKVTLEPGENFAPDVWLTSLRVDILEDDAPAVAAFDIQLMWSEEDRVQGLRIGPGTKTAESLLISGDEDLQQDLLRAQRWDSPLRELYHLSGDAPWQARDLFALRKAPAGVQRASGMRRKG